MSFIRTLFILLISCCSIHSTKGCATGWFGFYCQFECHCEDKKCDSDGLCTKIVACSTGWFGYKCQYYDLIQNSSNLMNLPKWLKDNNGATCNNNTSQLDQSVNITWSSGYIVQSVRIVVKNKTSLTRFQLSYFDGNSAKLDCENDRFIVIDETTVDYQCNNPNITVKKVVIEGDGITDLCSLYVDGGRNIALKQNTFQSSGSVIDSNKAVDGGTNQIYGGGSCTHSASTYDRHNWTLSYNESFVINRIFLYNRVDCCQERLANFIFETFTDENKFVFNYTDLNTSNTYEFVHYKNIPIKTVKITATNVVKVDNKDGIVLTLCEVETFGDCPPGKWSLECNRTCDRSCPTTCHVDDGTCDSTCVGYSNPPSCTEECEAGKWGINCSQICNSKCYETCNNVNGFCDQGCLGFNNPPVCNIACAPDRFGKDCSKQCSSNCLNGTCNRETGTCWECVPGFLGDHCDKECDSGFWGSNCSHNCSENCFLASCNKTDGVCDKGCTGFQNPPLCTLRCNQTFGHNCSQDCSTTCLNSTCHAVTGVCRLCVEGYEGEYCKKVLEIAVIQETNLAAIAGPVVAGVIVLGLIVVAVIIVIQRSRRKKLPAEPKTLLSHDQFDKLETNNFKHEHKDVKPNDAYQYENQVLELEENTSIDIKKLNTFMDSCKKQYFEIKFKAIPIATDVTTEAATSSENKNKNRYKNICPYDHSRVHLEINTSKNEGDYINASYIRGYNKEEMFIASQAPTKVIINDFIRMLWEQKVDKVVMLTNLIEDNKIKCEKYWPDDGTGRFGEISVTLKASQVFADYSIRSLELSKKNGESHTLTQFHFTSWPDKDVPPTTWNLVEFKHRVCLSPTTKPVVVHCSAGVGRTGTFIALLNVMRQAEMSGRVDFFKTVALLREDRIFMVQTASQYEFLHKAAQVAVMCMGSTMTANDFSERFTSLDDKESLQCIRLATEFKDLCFVCDNLQRSEKETGDSVYQNSQNINTSQQQTTTSSGFPNDGNFKIKLMKESKEMADCIDALLLPGYKQKDQNILTQLPTTTTVIDLWRLVVQQNVGLIVAFETDSTDSEKSVGTYLPSEERVAHGPYEVHTTMIKRSANWEERMMTVSSKKTFFKNESHNVIHLKCLFSDLCINKMLSILKKARSYNLANGKTLYMCRNGASYSGLAYILSLLMDRLDNDSCIAVPVVVGAIKTVVPEVVHDFDQYLFVHKVLQRYIIISCNYFNVGEDFLQKVYINSPILEKDSKEDNIDVYANV
ncbi:hypothetical protein Btru_034224 [Bulinus truncatus]|nr:hypothetical protein Btru_034224 [Bulinus truncatus]